MAQKTQKPVTLITEADIEALQGVLGSLKAGAREAHSKGNMTTFRVYQKLCKIVSPEVVKAHARKERQELARMNKDGQALKDAQPSNTSSGQ